MDDPKNTNASATGVPAGASESPQAPSALPFALPDGMSPELAQARLAELKTDDGWRARWIAGDARANTEFDALTRRAVGQPQPAAAPVPDENAEALKALGAPADISGYDLSNIRGADGGFIVMDGPTRELAAKELFPAAHALDLSQSDVAMIAGNVTHPVSYEDCEATLHRLWGESFESGLNDFRLAVGNNSKVRGLLEQYPETLGNNPMLISAVAAAFRRKQGRR